MPNEVDTLIGKLTFTDGSPSNDMIQKMQDNYDFVRALQAYVDAHQGASVAAFIKGFREAGVEDNDIIIFSELMDSQTLFLTPNADTVYYVGIINLQNGPMVFESPPDALGVIDDTWFGHVIDFGRPGLDRGEGGRFLLLPPDYDGSLPDSGFHVAWSRTNRVLVLGRSFLIDNDPKPVVEIIKKNIKIYPYTPGGVGTSIKTLLLGDVISGKPAEDKPIRYIEGSGLVFNTIPPSDHTYFDLVNEFVHEEAEGAFEPEIMGALAAIGIVKGQPLEPDERMRGTLDDAAAVGNATGRTLNFAFRGTPEEDFAYYPGSAWYNMLFLGGYSFDTPPPAVTSEGIKPYSPVGHRRLASRFSFFHWAVGITPAMCMRITGVGSQYLMSCMDADKNIFDGSKTYKCTLPPDIPHANFWSFTVYDNQTRSMLQTPQRWPRAGSQSYPTPAVVPNTDGSIDVYFGTEAPAGKESNWIQTLPGKGWFVCLRLYSSLQPFFDKTWRPGEIELVE
ncbi:MAG: DUF1214 domain-containing protein [Anaerolineales bacterium]|nr:DUF1214 domain-containing protein [Anaerolineales bacterium]